MIDTNASILLADEALRIIESVRDGFLLLDEKLDVLFANKSFYSIFHVSPQDTIGKHLYEIGNGQWNIPALRIFVEETLSKEKEFHDYKVSYNFPSIGEKVMLLNGVMVQHKTPLILLVISDVSAQAIAYQTLKESFESLEKMNNLMVGREIKMIELKTEIERLKKNIQQCLTKENPNVG